jgi:hypothetical protein
MIGKGINALFQSVKNVVGSLTDFVDVPYVPSISSIMAHLNTAYYHVHGSSFIYPKYAAPVTLTSSSGAWTTTGNIIEVIPANAITKAFDLHWASLSTISADLDGIIDIYAGASGSEVMIGAVDVSRSTTQSRENAMPVQIPQQPANTRISCKFSDSTTNARTVRVKFYGHVYSDSLT